MMTSTVETAGARGANVQGMPVGGPKTGRKGASGTITDRQRRTDVTSGKFALKQFTLLLTTVLDVADADREAIMRAGRDIPVNTLELEEMLQ